LSVARTVMSVTLLPWPLYRHPCLPRYPWTLCHGGAGAWMDSCDGSCSTSSGTRFSAH